AHTPQNTIGKAANEEVNHPTTPPHRLKIKLGLVVKVASSVAVEDEVSVSFALDLSSQSKDFVHRLGFFCG
ncbi:hypothetical protein, partial [Streptomyces mirabilis]|uniref:hypothetical protein n=1 Tax=Streptomyces mirabilis TaxID=68239 RepID=UPI00368FAC52